MIRRVGRCPDCRERKGRHKKTCRRRCPTCSKGVLTAAQRSITGPNWRRFDCGHHIDDDQVAREARPYVAVNQADIARDLIATLNTTRGTTWPSGT